MKPVGESVFLVVSGRFWLVFNSQNIKPPFHNSSITSEINSERLNKPDG